MQLALVNAIEERTLLDGILNVINERLDGRDGCEELGLEPFSDLRLARRGSRGGHDGTELLITGSVEESIICVQRGALLPARGRTTAYCHQ